MVRFVLLLTYTLYVTIPISIKKILLLSLIFGISAIKKIQEMVIPIAGAVRQTKFFFTVIGQPVKGIYFTEVMWLLLDKNGIILTSEPQSDFQMAIMRGILKELHRDKMLTDAQLSYLLSDLKNKNTCALLKEVI